MVESCISCEEIQSRICTLLDEISSLEGCQGAKISEGGVTFDYSEQIKSKHKALEVLEKLESRRCPKGAGDLYEWIHVPCVRPVTCTGSTCTVPSDMRQGRRRYRR